MSKYAVAKVFIVDNEDYIVSGEKDLVQKYIDGLYEDYCIRKDLESTDECHRCDICESLMSQGGRQECPVLVTSHEITESEKNTRKH